LLFIFHFFIISFVSLNRYDSPRLWKTFHNPNEWFNPLLEQTLPELADKLAEINADAVVNATRMVII